MDLVALALAKKYADEKVINGLDEKKVKTIIEEEIKKIIGEAGSDWDSFQELKEKIENIQLTPGPDGYSPVVELEQISDGVIVKVINKEGVTTATIYNGAQGIQGIQGEQGPKGDTGEQGDKGDKGDPGEPGVDGADYVLTDADKSEIAELAAGLVEVPEAPEISMQPLTFTGAVEATYDGSEPVEVVIPQGGGGVTPTAAEKIVDYTVDADGASAIKFVFTVAEYPALAKYNRLRGIVRRAANAGMEWVQVCVNNAIIGQTPKGANGMLGFEVLKYGDYYRGGTSSTQNISLYNVWTNASQSSYGGYNRLLPAKIDSLTSITVQSWVKFLDEGARIEIWGWNE